jgi:hypothetical protein
MELSSQSIAFFDACLNRIIAMLVRESNGSSNFCTVLLDKLPSGIHHQSAKRNNETKRRKENEIDLVNHIWPSSTARESLPALPK